MTPLQRHQEVYLKREDNNLTGSTKDRAITLQVDKLISLGFKTAIISSTGNAAISADYYCFQKNIPLTVFVSPKVNPQKLLLITHSKIITTDKPISSAFKESKNNQSYFLRQSTDPVALTGYSNIASELLEQLPKITSLFIPVGSGTTLLGISQKLPTNVKIFAIQPASHCPISSLFDQQYQAESSTITDALSAKLLPLKHKIVTAINISNGSGIVVQNNDVAQIHHTLTNSGIITSPEGALALAGYYKTKKTFDVGEYPVILLTGNLR